MAQSRHQVLLVQARGHEDNTLVTELEDAGHEVAMAVTARETRAALGRTEPPLDVVLASGLDRRRTEELRVTVRKLNPDLALLVRRNGVPQRPDSRGGVASLEVGDQDLVNALRWGSERTSYQRRIRFLEDHIFQSSNGPDEQIRETQDVAIFGLAKLVESRDSDTGHHLERMAEYSRLLATAVADHPLYIGYITDEYVWDIWRSAPLHDIGKVGVPDHILLKPGKLDAEEWVTMKTHSLIGGDPLRHIESRLHYRSFLQMGRDIAYCHHEKWNGQGYPFGLAGDDIPLTARIVALADVYDALTSKRPYKEPFSHEKACAIIEEGAGTHFDPTIYEGFLRVQGDFQEVAARYLDEEEPVFGELDGSHEEVVERYRRNGKRLRTLRKLMEERMANPEGEQSAHGDR